MLVKNKSLLPPWLLSFLPVLATPYSRLLLAEPLKEIKPLAKKQTEKLTWQPMMLTFERC